MTANYELANMWIGSAKAQLDQGDAATAAAIANAHALLAVADAINADRTRVEHTTVQLNPTVERALLRRIGA